MAPIIVGEVREETERRSKKLFSSHFLSFLNKAVLRHRNGRVTTFYWLPYVQDYMRQNEWAMLSVYRDDAVVEHTSGWTYGEAICGPAIVKRTEWLLPYVKIGPRTGEEDERLQCAAASMNGFWHVAENPFAKERQLFADNFEDLVLGRLIFSY